MTTANSVHDTQANRVAAWTRLLVCALVVALGVLLVRVIQLKTLPGSRFLAAMTPRLSSHEEFTRRGDLLDVRGRIMATSTLGHRLFVDPSEVDDLQTIAVDIADAIGASPRDIDRTILAASSPQYSPRPRCNRSSVPEANRQGDRD